LLVFSIGLNYYLVKEYGIIGAAVAGFISLSIYNAIRLFFIWIKYKMQPFTVQTLWAILSAAACYFIVYFVFQNVSGWAGVILKGTSFSLLFIVSVWYFKLTPDLQPVVSAIKKRLNIN